MLHEDFQRWLETEWQDGGDLPLDLRRLSVKLKAWNKATFGNIFQRKKLNELRLGVCNGHWKEVLPFI